MHNVYDGIKRLHFFNRKHKWFLSTFFYVNSNRCMTNLYLSRQNEDSKIDSPCSEPALFVLNTNINSLVIHVIWMSVRYYCHLQQAIYVNTCIHTYFRSKYIKADATRQNYDHSLTRNKGVLRIRSKKSRQQSVCLSVCHQQVLC